MFKKLYKEANNNITPNRALIDEIYKKYDKQNHGAPFMRIYRYSAYAAAALVLAVCVYSYPQIVKFASLRDGNTPHTEVTVRNSNALKPGGNETAEKGSRSENTNIGDNNVAADKNTHGSEANKGQDNNKSGDGGLTAENQKSQNKNAVKDESKSSAKSGDKNSVKDENQSTAAADDKSVVQNENQIMQQKTAPNTSAEKGGGSEAQMSGAAACKESADPVAGDGLLAYSLAGGEIAENDAESGNTVSRAYDSNDSDGGSGGNSGSGMRAKSYGDLVIWSMDKYCDYLGVDLSKINIGSGFKNVTPNEIYISKSGDAVVNDTLTLTYTSNSSIALITVSKLQNLMPGGIRQLKTVNGIKVYTNGENSPSFYLETKGVSFAIFCQGLSNAEQSAVIGSVCAL